MTPIELQRKLEAKVADLNTAKLIFPIAQEAQRMLIKRLFDEGEGAQGKLGKYSTDAAYFTKEQFKNKGAFKAQGKSESRLGQKRKTTTVFDITTKKRKSIAIKSNNTERTSMYLPNGYKELKQIQGYESSFVNLTYSSDLRNDFSTGMMIKGDKVIAVVKRGINADKTKWLSDKYGEKTFKHTEEEKDFFTTEVSKELANYFTN